MRGLPRARRFDHRLRQEAARPEGCPEEEECLRRQESQLHAEVLQTADLLQPLQGFHMVSARCMNIHTYTHAHRSRNNNRNNNRPVRDARLTRLLPVALARQSSTDVH